jgi:hypothetical protein
MRYMLLIYSQERAEAQLDPVESQAIMKGGHPPRRRTAASYQHRNHRAPPERQTGHS